MTINSEKLQNINICLEINLIFNHNCKLFFPRLCKVAADNVAFSTILISLSFVVLQLKELALVLPGKGKFTYNSMKEKAAVI